jgi:alanyl-tRNA synthetase
VGEDDVGGRDMAYRVVADHIRTLSFAIADGAAPGPDGRNYVLRRILRRAVRYGRDVLGARDGFFVQLVDAVVDTFGGFYPELLAKRGLIAEIIR